MAKIKGMELERKKATLVLLNRVQDINQRLTLAKLCLMEVCSIAALQLSVFVILSISTHARCKRGAQKREHGG